MNKSRRYKRRKRDQPPRESTPSSAVRRKLPAFLSSLWSIVVGVSVMMTIMGTVYAFAPKVSVSSGATLDPLDPFEAPFIISNESYLPISDVTFACKASKIQPSEFAEEVAKERDGKIPILDSWSFGPGPRYVATTFNPGEKRTFICLSIAGLLKSPITSASIEISVTYRPAWILPKEERRFRFDTAMNKSGQLIWLPPRDH